MLKNNQLLIAKGEQELYLRPEMANRHGLITGASGTGKTVTLKVMAESFSDLGVPVFLQDIKGDISGMIMAGEKSEKVQERLDYFGISDFEMKSFPARFWDVYGEKGHPVRVTVSDMGPTLFARILSLTEAQESILSMVFKIADDAGLLLIDIKDLRSMLNFVVDHKKDLEAEYGAINVTSINTINRKLLTFDDKDAALFGEPALDITDWMRTDINGKGYINILHSVKLSANPVLYGTFMLWMLSELYERLPEVGDLEKPRMVFFFDEAHMLFSDAPSALKQKIVQVIKLIRSKGVGIYFITQSPADIPDEVLAQLSNRVQHALRAYTPMEQKAVKVAAQAFRPNPKFKTEEVISSLATGEALVSFLDGEGAPMIVEKAIIAPPQSFMGAAPEEIIQKQVISCEFDLKYRNAVDRESAYEVIKAENEQMAAEKEAAEKAKEEEKAAAMQAKAEAKEQVAREKEEEKLRKLKEKEAEKEAKKTSQYVSRMAGNAASSVARSLSTQAANAMLGDAKSTIAGKAIKTVITSTSGSVGRSVGQSILRGILGSIK